MTWAHSPTYGTAVALGPTQEAVYRFVLGATDHGRRPTYTLATIASRTGRPVSSVHEALGRLRALGLIGFDARMGRTGGHRLWRVARRTLTRSLDAIRHRLAVARIIRRWYATAPPVAASTEGVTPQAGTLWGDAPPIEHEGPTFREGMERAGFTPWWRLADDHGQSDSHDPDSRSGVAHAGDGHGLLGAESG